LHEVLELYDWDGAETLVHRCHDPERIARDKENVFLLAVMGQ
jgi:hypothetical protein